MSRLVARAENWERVYKAFENTNLAAFEYGAIKQSLLDYLRLYYPEVFNDFIESSELVAVIEAFAKIGDSMAYRFDMNARENLLPVAKRRESILRLAKHISYTASRPIPARGLVKIESVSTTQNVADSNGTNLSNRTIHWNDATNNNWKAQFITVMNLILDQGFGHVTPSDRFQIQDELFELYRMTNTPINRGVVQYTANVSGRSINMELVPVTYDKDAGIVERRPDLSPNMTILYGNDGLGDGSKTTGFFMMTKQGQLAKLRTTFDGITPNDTYTISVDNINDTDVWLNEIDPATGKIVDVDNILTRHKGGKSGEWEEVESTYSQNILFNTNPFRNKYEVETLTNNHIRLLFGDGNFSNIPMGTFEVWYRTSLDETLSIPKAAISRQTATFTYIDVFGKTQTMTMTFSLVNSLQNGSAAESDEHIKLVAPSVYYSQNRMVNGEDYNMFPLQDPSIMKMRAINRTFVGDSRYTTWSDASGTYDNVSLYGNDGTIYLDRTQNTINVGGDVSHDVLITQYIEPLLSTTDMYTNLVSAGVPPTSLRRNFTAEEREDIITALTPPPYPNTVLLYFNLADDRWYAIKSTDIGQQPAGDIDQPLITIDQGSIVAEQYLVSWLSTKFVLNCPTMDFWMDNDGNKVINYNTLNSALDSINILQANVNANRTGVLQQNWKYSILGRTIIQSGSSMGLPNIHEVGIIPVDVYGSPDGIDPFSWNTPHKAAADLLIPKISVPVSELNAPVTLPVNYITKQLIGTSDITVVDQNGVPLTFTEIVDSSGIGHSISITKRADTTTANITVQEYVYFVRDTMVTDWELMPDSYGTLIAYSQSLRNGDQLMKRNIGKRGINFMWYHVASRYQLVDPSPTNINDMYIITKGYYNDFRRWLDLPNVSEPSVPTPSDLRMSYNYLYDYKMISDSIIFRPGKFRLLFGPKAAAELRGRIKMVRSEETDLTDNQIKNIATAVVKDFFELTKWEFGETFYFEELAAAIMNELSGIISSVVFVPTYPDQFFGDGYEIKCMEDEVFHCDISNNDFDIVQGYTPTNLKQVPFKTS